MCANSTRCAEVATPRSGRVIGNRASPRVARLCPPLARRGLPRAEYAQVTRMLGNGRLEAFCFDGVNRLCHIRGKLRKRVWIGVGDIVLLGLREFQDQKVPRQGHLRAQPCPD